MNSLPVERLCGGEVEFAPPMQPFDERVLSLLEALSAALLGDPEARRYPEVVTFGFFCRRANLARLRAECACAQEKRLGRGLVFHIAPGNVPINFAYSLLAALLAGNRSVVRASSREFPQVRVLCAALDKLLHERFTSLAPYISVVRYPRERQDITEAYSAICDARVIWGGDETICRVRKASIPPHAFDIPFPDRYSLLALDAEAVAVMDEDALTQAAAGFYNDTYLTDQNACTSPRLIYWLGSPEAADKAGERFFAAVCEYARPRYRLEPVTAVDKLTAACRTALELPGAHVLPGADNLAARVRISKLTPVIERLRCSGGFFIEYVSETLDALRDVVTPRYQTLSYLGLDPDALRDFITSAGLSGLTRVAPLGHTMDFSLLWDGYDLIAMLSRTIA